MVMFTFFVFDQKIPFLGKFGPKNKNRQFNLKVDTYINSNLQNSIVIFIFFFLFRSEIFFWVNLIQKLKIVSLS